MEKQSIELNHSATTTTPSSPPSAAFIEKFLHHQEDIGRSSGDFGLGLFRIDSGNDNEDDNDDGTRYNPTLDFESQSQHQLNQCGIKTLSNNTEWKGSLPLYKTSVDVDFAEASIVAPVDVEEGNILRVDMGLRRILVAEVPIGGVKSGEIFKAPYKIYKQPLSDLQIHREKAYNDGHYHGWVANLFGCCQNGADWHSRLGAVCCPCFLLSTILSRMHLNWCGKHISSISFTTQQRRQRCTMICILMLYTIVFILTAMLTLNIVRAIYCLEKERMFEESVEEPEMREDEAKNVEIILPFGGRTCSYRVNKVYLSSVFVLDLFVWGYILLITSRARTAIREQHFIYGGSIEDCWVSLCCNCCVLDQLAKEASYEDHETRRFSNVDVAIGEPNEFLNENNREGHHYYRPIV